VQRSGIQGGDLATKKYHTTLPLPRNILPSPSVRQTRHNLVKNFHIRKNRTVHQHFESLASTFSFNYNALGNLTQFTQSIAGAALETGILSSYNANGQFLAGTSTTGDKVKHTYTPRGQLATTSLITPAVPAVAAT
jgi:hypothetical protein